MTKTELLSKLKALGTLSSEQRNSIVCSLVGHSRIQTTCFSYYYCARCGEQLGDTLASTYPGAGSAVIVGHDCPVCRENAETLTWRDKLYAPNPFPKVKP